MLSGAEELLFLFLTVNEIAATADVSYNETRDTNVMSCLQFAHSHKLHATRLTSCWLKTEIAMPIKKNS